MKPTYVLTDGKLARNEGTTELYSILCNGIIVLVLIGVNAIRCISIKVVVCLSVCYCYWKGGSKELFSK